MTCFKTGRRLLVALVSPQQLTATFALALSLSVATTLTASTPALAASSEMSAAPSPTATLTPAASPSATPQTTDIIEAYPVKATPAATPTPVETIAVATPAPKPTVSPATVAVAKPTPFAAKEGDTKVVSACKEVYSSAYQEKFRSKCIDGANQAMKTGWASSAAQCRADHALGERQRLVCQVGTTIGDELKTGKITYTERASACRDLFPIISPVDVYFQESCLSGSDLQAHTHSKATIGNCRWLVPNDRGFLAPCAAGISLTANLLSGEKTTAADLNKLCSQYFDKAQFNLGYRSCLNGLALSLTPDDKKIDVVHRCGELSSDSSGSERGSCIVGFELYRYLHKRDELAKRFKACGDTKVTYDERDTLACLTASSLTDFMDRGKARKACKEIFTGRKNHSRADCERIL